MSQLFRITREIGIDAAHRVPEHGSKCRSLHGHRYTVQATWEGALVTQAGDAAEGMVEDFSQLKQWMLEEIDLPCDHGTILYAQDPLLSVLTLEHPVQIPVAVLGRWGKLYVVPFIPTAENLARHWFERLQSRTLTGLPRSCRIATVRVYETPNCWADFPG